MLNVCSDVYTAKICEGCSVYHPSQLQHFCSTVRTWENFLTDNYTVKVMISTILHYLKSERMVCELIFSSYEQLSPRELNRLQDVMDFYQTALLQMQMKKINKYFPGIS